MTSKERVAAAMNLRPVDRVPLMCQMSIGHMLLQLKVSPADFWFDPHVFADGLLQLRELYGFDGILISLHGHDPDWRNDVQSRRLTDEGELVLWKNGDATLCLFNDLPRFIPRKAVPAPQFSAFSPDELPQTLEYIPVSGGLHFTLNAEHTFDVIVDIVRRAGKEFSIHGEVTSPFDYFLDIFGYQEGLMAMAVDPDKCRKILQHFTVLVQQLAIAMCTTGIDALKVSSPFAGSGFISPGFYATFVLPY
ncbi:MAG: uroporphyrinogen decarboxylase family protein, partial [Bacteroidota bacterium]